MNRTEWIEEYVIAAGLFDILGPDFQDAIIGVANSFGREPALAYDYNKVIKIFAKQFAEDIEDDDDPYMMAVEWFEYNVIGYGRNDVETPIFIETVEITEPTHTEI